VQNKFPSEDRQEARGKSFIEMCN